MDDLMTAIDDDLFELLRSALIDEQAGNIINREVARRLEPSPEPSA